MISTISRNRIPAAIGSLLLVVVAGCSGGDPGLRPVAWIGEDSLTRSELDSYLELNLARSDGENDWVGEGADRVKSRLLDAWIDERLLLAEAVRRGIRVSDEELEAELEMAAVSVSTDDVAEQDRLLELARRRLMIFKLQDAARDALPPPGADEVEAYAEVHEQRLSDALRSFRVRSLRFDRMETAASVHGEIAAGEVTFEGAAESRKLDAGLVPVDLAWSSIPESMRPALDRLQPGEVSPPLEYGGNTYLFEMISRTPDTPRREDLLRMAGNELQSLQRADADDALLRDLRNVHPVRLTDQLPFSYVPSDD